MPSVSEGGGTLSFIRRDGGAVNQSLSTQHRARAARRAVPFRSRSGWTGRLPRLALLLVFGLGLAPATAFAEVAAPWSPETVRIFARIAVQDGGRVMPLNTYARYTLLRFSGRTRLEDGSGTLSAVEWLMECLFRPDRARGRKCFQIDHPEILDALGVSRQGRRDRYSYAELAPGRAKLAELGLRFAEIPSQERTALEGQVVNLALNVEAFERLTRGLDFARRDFSTDGLEPLLSPGYARLSDLLEKAAILGAVYEPDTAPPALARLLQEIDLATRSAGALALIPPPGASADAPRWLTPLDVVGWAFEKPGTVNAQIELVSALEDMAAHADDPAAFHRHAARFAADARRLAESRGEYSRIRAEVFYHSAGIFGWPLFYTFDRALYLAGFALVALLWLKPGSSRLAWFAGGVLAVATVILVAGIALRCYIRVRPPVTNLYETILFVTATAVTGALVLEYIDRRRVALSLAAVLGALGLFVAHKYEAQEAADTLPSMIAVLDANFWLSTHVTTVTLGYAAGLLAAGLAHVFVFAKLLGVSPGDNDFYGRISRMVYGVICFGLLFSTLGTVLGGIWANDSWGRFWGWDPKENGALMIVLWELAMLHARAGGYLRDYGMNLAALVGGMIVGFSWFGTNLLGVGLHSYGFTQGIHGGLVAFYGIETVVLFLGIAAWLWEEVLGVSFAAPPGSASSRPRSPGEDGIALQTGALPDPGTSTQP